MKQYLAKADTGRFLGLFSTLINAAFSYSGVEMVAVAAGEAENPRSAPMWLSVHARSTTVVADVGRS